MATVAEMADRARRRSTRQRYATSEFDPPEITATGDAIGAAVVEADARAPRISGATPVMERTDRLDALVAKTRLRTGQFPIAVPAAPSPADRTALSDLAEAGISASTPVPGDAGQSDRPLMFFEREQQFASDIAGHLDAPFVPQAINETEPTEKNSAPFDLDGELGGAPDLSEWARLDEDRQITGLHAPAKPRRGFRFVAVVAVVGALSWFAEAWVVPRYRLGLSGARAIPMTAPVPVETAPAAAHAAAVATSPAMSSVPAAPASEGAAAPDGQKLRSAPKSEVDARSERHPDDTDPNPKRQVGAHRAAIGRPPEKRKEKPGGAHTLAGAKGAPAVPAAGADPDDTLPPSRH